MWGESNPNSRFILFWGAPSLECIIAFTVYCKLDTPLSVCNGMDLLLNINNLTVPLKAEETAQVCHVNYVYYNSALASVIEMKIFWLRFVKAEAEFLNEFQTKTIPPSQWFKKSKQKPRVWKLSRLCPETSTKFYVHEFGLRSNILPYQWSI